MLGGSRRDPLYFAFCVFGGVYAIRLLLKLLQACL